MGKTIEVPAGATKIDWLLAGKFLWRPAAIYFLLFVAYKFLVIEYPWYGTVPLLAAIAASVYFMWPYLVEVCLWCVLNVKVQIRYWKLPKEPYDGPYDTYTVKPDNWEPIVFSQLMYSKQKDIKPADRNPPPPQLKK